MQLSPAAQDDAATQIADSIRLTINGHRAVATSVGQAGYPGAAIVAITKTGQTDCTAKIAVYSNRVVYVSAAGTYVSYPTRWACVGWVICGLLSMERG